MAEDQVKIYALSTCPWCKKTVRWFTTERNIPTEVIEVDTLTGTDADAVVDEVRRISNGQLPVTILNDEVIIGYSPEEFAKHLRGDYAVSEE